MTQVLWPTTEIVSVHNIESDFDQEDEQPLAKQPLGGEKKRNKVEGSQDERLVLTPQDQEYLLKEIVDKQGMDEIYEYGKTFEEEIYDKLRELHRQQELNVDIALQASLARQIASPKDPKHIEEEEKDEEEEQSDVHIVTANIMPHKGEKDKDVPQWLDFTFKKKKRKAELPKVTLQ